MATRFVDQKGRQVVVGRQIGRRGGEGSAYEATSHPGFVVKLYHEAPSQDKAAKLWHLTQLAAANPALLKFAAWPTEIVWKEGQAVCGFLMPLVKGKEIHQLFGPRERFVEFPSVGWDFLVHVARNCAAAFDSVHDLGVVIGDVNEGNLLVTTDGTVRLIDCDSYQVQNGKHLWTCDVGIPLWTAPELQGRNFRNLHRTPNHDLFGLATLIFKLLFMGRHPYAGIPTTSGDFVLEKAIADYMFAFSQRSPALGLRPPPHCLSLTAFPQSYVERFEKAFMRGSEAGRPTAGQWAQAMEALLGNLAKCGRDPSHKYPKNLSHCPWCEIAGSGGPNFFISVSVAAPGNTADAAALWSAIARVERGTIKVRDITTFRFPAVVGTPLPSGISKSRPQFIAGCVLLALGAILLFSGNGAALGVVAALVACGLMSGGSKSPEFQAEYARRKAADDRARADMQSLVQQLSSLPGHYQSEFTKRLDDLKKAHERYSRLGQERAVEMQKLEQKKRELQLNQFLDRQLIIRAGIQGIGPGRAATLQAYGVESALDVTPTISVPGIGVTYMSRLLEWRRHCEGKFRFNPSDPIPPQEIHQLNVRMTTLSNNLLSDLKQGPQTLANLTSSAKALVVQLEAQADATIHRQAKAAADMAAISN